MVTVNDLFGPQAMLATELRDVQHAPGSQVVSAKARLANQRNPLGVFLVPVVRERDGDGHIPEAAGWRPIPGWQTALQDGGPAKTDPPDGLESVVRFDFSLVPAAEGAAVMFMVLGPKKVFEFQLKMTTADAPLGPPAAVPTRQEQLEALKKELENLIFRAVLRKPS